MDITQGIRARQQRPYPNQQTHRQSLLPRWKAPILTTLQRRQGHKEPQFSLHYPGEITLKVKWEAIPRDPTLIAATCMNGEYAYEACRFYDPDAAQDSELATHSVYQAIALHYQGYGAYRFDSKKSRPFAGNMLEDAILKLDNDTLISSYPFVVQTLSPLMLRRRLLAEQTWLVTYPHGPHAGQINVTPYYGYGVYAKSGSPIHHIEQVYGRLATQGNRTIVEVKRASVLQRQGLGPPLGGKHDLTTIIYPGIFQDSPYSLSDAIARGEIHFILQCDDEPIVYRSLHYTQENSHAQALDIVFVVRR